MYVAKSITFHSSETYMKVLFLSLLLAFSITGVALSQDSTSKDTAAPAPAASTDRSTSNSSWGFKVMAGVGMPSYEGVESETSTAGAWSAGLFWNWSTGGAVAFAVQPELHYIYESGVTTTATGAAQLTTSTQSLRLPVLLKLELLDRAVIQPSIYAGPSFSYLLGAKDEGNGTTVNIEDPNKFQVGLAVGIDVTFLEIFVVDLRYNTKFTSIKEENLNGSTVSLSMNSFRAGVGLRF